MGHWVQFKVSDNAHEHMKSGNLSLVHVFTCVIINSL